MSGFWWPRSRSTSAKERRGWRHWCAKRCAPIRSPVWCMCSSAKRADRVKLIFWDGTGVVLVAKRLEDGKFRWPAIRDGVMRLSAAQLQALLEGLDWRRGPEARRAAAPAPGGLGGKARRRAGEKNPG